MSEDRKDWEVLTTETVYENPWIRVDHHEVIAPTGNPGIYGKVHFKNYATGILPIDEDGNTWLVGQQRFCFGKWSWELPEGGGPKHLPPEDSARRELAEEVGLEASTLIPLFENAHMSNSITDEVAFAWIGCDLSPCASHRDETEFLEVRKIHLSEVYKMMDRGEITDMFTLAMLYRAYHLAHTGCLPEALAKHFLRRLRT